MYQIPASTSEPGSCQHPLVRGWCLWLLNMAPPDPSGKPAGTNDAKLPSLETTEHTKSRGTCLRAGYTSWTKTPTSTRAMPVWDVNRA